MSANEEIAFGLRVRELRQSREWSQGRLAQEMRQRGLKATTARISRLERGDRNILPPEPRVLAAIFETDERDLWGE